MSAAPKLTISAKRLLARLLGRQILGVIWYLRAPGLGPIWGKPFNGQSARQALFKMLVARTQPRAIVETGTFLGTTAVFMAEAGLPVFTIEAHPRFYGFARARFWRENRVTLLHGDSRSELRELFEGPLRPLADDTVFFYLDAHWDDDLPLAEEIDSVFRRCASAVVMVDDFQVPADAGYGFDDYGPGKALTLDYIKEKIAAHQLAVYYPSTSSSAESGARRGCVILVKQAVHGPALAAISLLQTADQTAGRYRSE